MADNKIQMPSSGGGLIRYYDDIKSKLKISPIAVLAMIVLVLIAEFVLHRTGWLG